MAKNKPQNLKDDDIEFMSSLSQAALEKPAFNSQVLVWTILAVLIFLITWANYAELDKIIRGEGKVVPSIKIQVVQNLEGGIVSNIYVRSGDHVKQGQSLVRLDNTQFASSFGETQTQSFDLKARAARLRAEAFGKPFKVIKHPDKPFVSTMFAREESLYKDRIRQLKTTQKILDEKVSQHKSELKEAYNQLEQLSRSYKLLKREVAIMKPLVREGIASEVDLLKTQREENEVFTQLRSTELSIPKIKSIITEAKAKQTEAKQKFENEAQQELNEVLAKLELLERSKTALEDKVRRTNITSPVDGTISELLVGTIGEIVQPGSDIIKIVPSDDSLVLETKILPADIGFVYPGLTAKVKFTAYDFAIYGGLDGIVEKISANTIVDEEGNSFYIARIKTTQNYLGQEKSPLVLLPGMTATVDVVVGKHTVLDYIIKPIIKAKDLALRES